MRTTQKQLEGLANTINRVTGHPETYSSVIDGQRVTNIGHYYIDYAYGGSKLVQTVNDGGGIREITSGYRPKSETWDLMHAYLSGLQAGK